MHFQVQPIKTTVMRFGALSPWDYLRQWEWVGTLCIAYTCKYHVTHCKHGRWTKHCLAIIMWKQCSLPHSNGIEIQECVYFRRRRPSLIWCQQNGSFCDHYAGWRWYATFCIDWSWDALWAKGKQTTRENTGAKSESVSYQMYHAMRQSHCLVSTLIISS